MTDQTGGCPARDGAGRAAGEAPAAGVEKTKTDPIASSSWRNDLVIGYTPWYKGAILPAPDQSP